ncbi:MAG: glycosyltransferase [Gemmobacter sp.]|nr:glycosyltransferase [Gemmobacter sp.]
MRSVVALIIPNLSSGGAERVVACLAQALAEHYDTHIFIRPGGGREYQVGHVPIHEVDFTAAALRERIGALNVDVVLDHFHWDMGHVKMMSELADAGVRIVLSEHNAYHYPLFQGACGKPGYDSWFSQRYAHYRKFAGVTLLNDDTLQYFARHLDNVVRIENPVPYAPPEPAWAERRTMAPKILNVSHFGKTAKRLDLLYKVFAQVGPAVPDSTLVILGSYNWLQDQYYRQASGVDGDRVMCFGRSGVVAHHYEEASVFALTSEIEGQPMVLLEAAAHGVPQVAFDLPGLRDQVIDGETGFLVPFNDVDAFAERVTRLLRDPELAQRMGQAARSFVQQKFAVDRVVELWRAVIDQVIAHGRLPATPAAVSAPLAAADARWQAYWKDAARHATAALPPKISFLVPVHGTEEVLGRCLDSIRSQSLQEFECIIIDDASPGDVPQIVRQSVGNDGRFRVIRHVRNRGLYQARTTAAAAASGLFLAHVDSDDYLHPQFAAMLFAEAITTGAEIVECRATELDCVGRPIRFNTMSVEGPLDGDRAACVFFNNGMPGVLWNKIYSRDLWNRVPGHDQVDNGLTICEDLLRNSLLFPHCRRYSSVPDCLYYYCRRPTSVVRGGDLDRLKAKLRDVSFSYAMALDRLTSADMPAARAKLEKRRAADIGWYIAEFTQRNSLSALWPDMDSP